MRGLGWLLVALLAVAALGGMYLFYRLQPPAPKEMERASYGSCDSDVTKNGATSSSSGANEHLVVAAGNVVAASDGTSAHYRLVRLAGGGTRGSGKYLAHEWEVRITGGQIAPDNEDRYRQTADAVVLRLRMSSSLVLTCSAPKL